MSDAVTSPPLALPSWGYKIKKAAWIAFAVFGFLLAAIVVVPHFVDLGLFKRTYLPRIEEALNRRVDVGEVRLSPDAIDPHVESKSFRWPLECARQYLFLGSTSATAAQTLAADEGPFRGV
jgi:hypothetical protein